MRRCARRCRRFVMQGSWLRLQHEGTKPICNHTRTITGNSLGFNFGELIIRKMTGDFGEDVFEGNLMASKLNNTSPRVSFDCLKLILNGLPMSARLRCERWTDVRTFCCEAHSTECDEVWENVTAASEGKLTGRRIWSNVHFGKVTCCIATRFYKTTRRARAVANDTTL